MATPVAAGGFEAQVSRVLAEARGRPRIVKVAHRDGLLDRLNDALAHLVEETRPAVVKVVLRGKDGGKSVVGTGFFVEGLILTNHHVVGPSAEAVTVRFHDGDQTSARVVARNARKDVAFLRSVRTPAGLTLGSTARLRQGHLLLALGHPLGLPLSASLGVVSSVGPVIEGFYVRFVQTDAAVNPGNSGGPLLAADGTVVGMNTAILTESGGHEGLSFAVPAETLRRLLEQYRRLGHIRPGFLGIQLSTEAAKGARIAAVTAGSPAAGRLEPGDRILGVAGRLLPEEPGEAVGEALVEVSDRAPGDALELDVERRGRRFKVRVVLGELPAGLEGPPEGSP